MRKQRPLIVLLTDFGVRDPYVPIMKAVIESINPEAKVIDMVHDVESFNIMQAAFILSVSTRYFPRGTVFVVVVDPGVGTSRRAIVMKTCDGKFFVAPDNGVLSPIISSENLCEIREITNENFMLKPISGTFHGRDVFAPVAAYITLGTPLHLFGPEIKVDDVIKINMPKPSYHGNYVQGAIVYFDKFGNAITNIEVKNVRWLRPSSKVKVIVKREKFITKFVKSFGYVGEGETALIEDSFGLLELVVNRGSAKDRYGLKYGYEIIVERV